VVKRVTGRPAGLHHRRQRGLALVLVLWVVVLLSLLAASTLDTARTNVNLAFNLAEGARAELMAEAAGNLAIYALLNGDPTQDGWQSDGSIYAWRDDDAELRVRVTEEGGRLDINEASPRLIASFMEAAGLERHEAERIADSLADFRDPDDDRRLNGAEDSDYEAAGEILGAKDAPFETIDELHRIPGVTPELFERIAPELTVYSGLDRPDGESATPIVRAALENRKGEDVAGLIGAVPEIDAIIENETPEILVKGDGRLGTSRGLYRIEAAAAVPSGAVSGIELVIRIVDEPDLPYELLNRRLTATGLFPEVR
jgi:general secretion pathway protein K